jgi:hypothetical protein
MKNSVWNSTMFVALAALTAAVGFTAASTVGQPALAAKVRCGMHTVTIKSGVGAVPPNISVCPNDKVRWTSGKSAKFHIHFDHSPFTSTSGTGDYPAAGTTTISFTSGRAIAKQGADCGSGCYKYTVTIQGDKKSPYDPHVIIVP